MSRTRSTISTCVNTLTLSFGTPDKPANVAAAAGAGNMNWQGRSGVTAGTGVTDVLGNLGASTNRAETADDGDC